MTVQDPLGGFRLGPQTFHLVETGVVRGASLFREGPFDGPEAALEFGIRPAQGGFRIDAEVARQIGGGEQEDIDLVLDALRQALPRHGHQVPAEALVPRSQSAR